MTIEGKSILITGASRGVGRALVDEALRRGARQVYAAARGPFTHSDERVTSLILDVTDAAQIQAAVERVDQLDYLVNNAGVGIPDDLSSRSALEQHLAVNLFGTWAVSEAFLPELRRSRGAIVSVLSIAVLAAVPVLPAYSISKAASFSLAQSLRARLASAGVSVHAVLAGPIDTDMVRDLDLPKASPESVAQAILDGVDRGEEEIFPDVVSASFAETWRSGPAKALERENAKLLPPAAAAA